MQPPATGCSRKPVLTGYMRDENAAVCPGQARKNEGPRDDCAFKPAALRAAARPAARPPSGRAAWAPVPNGGETPGRPPYTAPAVLNLIRRPGTRRRRPLNRCRPVEGGEVLFPYREVYLVRMVARVDEGCRAVLPDLSPPAALARRHIHIRGKFLYPTMVPSTPCLPKHNIGAHDQHRHSAQDDDRSQQAHQFGLSSVSQRNGIMPPAEPAYCSGSSKRGRDQQGEHAERRSAYLPDQGQRCGNSDHARTDCGAYHDSWPKPRLIKRLPQQDQGSNTQHQGG